VRRLIYVLSSTWIGSFAVGQDLQWARNPANQHWYGISRQPTTWSASEAQAIVEGGHLATISSSTENSWVQSTFTGFNPFGFWIGFNDIATENSFVWSSGESFPYTNWAPGEPNNGSGVEDAAHLNPGSAWRWSDAAPSATSFTGLVEINRLPGAGYTLPASISVQAQPAHLALGDLNGDSKLDLVIPNSGAASVSYLLGNGDGTFGTLQNLTTLATPRTTVVGDFDGDTDADIVVACGDGSAIQIFLGSGSGSFTLGSTVTLSGKGHGLAAADLDGDGDLDLAVTTIETQDRLVVLRNSGSATFATPALYATGSRPNFVTARDIDGDSDVDLVVSNFDSDDVGLYYNQGNGTFITGALLARGNGPGRVAVSDIDLDGFVDLAIPNRLDNSLRIWWGTGGGSFLVGPAIVAGFEPIACIAADMDGDQRDDLITSCFGSDSAVIYYQRNGGFLDGPKDLFVGDGTVGAAAGDLTGDGRADLAFTTSLSAKAVTVLKLSRDCNANGVDDPRDITLGASPDCNANGIPDECDLAPTESFDCDDNGVIDSCEIAGSGALDLDLDGTLDECEIAGTPFCFGDGTGAACPCDPGQAGSPGTGCSNSFGTSAALVAVGNPDVTADSVSLRATGVLPNAVGLFFQGNAQQLGGLGTTFGDGLLCVNIAIKRLGIRYASSGNMAYGRDVLTDIPIAVIGEVPVSGATRYYQVWYRDAVNFCSPTTSNTSNGVRIIWTP